MHNEHLEVLSLSVLINILVVLHNSELERLMFCAGRDKQEDDPEKRARLAQFEGARSISSAAYFGREEENENDGKVLPLFTSITLLLFLGVGCGVCGVCGVCVCVAVFMCVLLWRGGLACV